MARRLDFSVEVTPFATVSAIINDESDEHVLSIELDHGAKIVFRGADIGRLHKALRQCDDAFKGLGQAARHIEGWGEYETEDGEALTDGAGVGAVERAVAAEEAPGEAGPSGVVWPPGVIGTLASLTHGRLLSPGNALFSLLIGNNLIKIKPGSGDWYTISDAGRAALEAADAREACDRPRTGDDD